MRTPIIVFPTNLWHELTDYLLADRSLETMAMGLFSTSSAGTKQRLLIRQTLLPKPSDYASRSRAFVALSVAFIESCHAACEAQHVHLLDIHTHPWSERVQFSTIDDNEVLKTKIPYMQQYLPTTQSAFLVMGQDETIVEARLWDMKRQQLVSIPEIRIV